MAITAARVTVGTTATKLAENTSGDTSDLSNRSFVLKNVTGTAAIFTGPSGVTISTGFQWDPADGPYSPDLEPGEEMWGVVASGTQVVHVQGAGR